MRMLFRRLHLLATFILGLSVTLAQESAKPAPKELDFLKGSIGVWDAAIEVWSQGPDGESIKFSGVEMNRAYGEYWIASDFDSEFAGQTMKVHSIVGYDLDQGKLIGKVIDHGPYAASMTGEYDTKAKAVHWTTKAKMPDGTTIIQKTVVTQKSPDERVLVLSVPDKAGDGFVKFMEIKFTKRASE